jgi:hypothetical protein
MCESIGAPTSNPSEIPPEICNVPWLGAKKIYSAGCRAVARSGMMRAPELIDQAQLDGTRENVS